MAKPQFNLSTFLFLTTFSWGIKSDLSEFVMKSEFVLSNVSDLIKIIILQAIVSQDAIKLLTFEGIKYQGINT